MCVTAVSGEMHEISPITCLTFAFRSSFFLLLIFHFSIVASSMSRYIFHHSVFLLSISSTTRTMRQSLWCCCNVVYLTIVILKLSVIWSSTGCVFNRPIVKPVVIVCHFTEKCRKYAKNNTLCTGTCSMKKCQQNSWICTDLEYFCCNSKYRVST